MGVYFDLHHHRKSNLSANGATWIVANTFGEVSGFPTLSQDRGTIGELNAAIDRLQADLEKVRAEGKRLFKAIDKERAAHDAYTMSKCMAYFNHSLFGNCVGGLCGRKDG